MKNVKEFLEKKVREDRGRSDFTFNNEIDYRGVNLMEESNTTKIEAPGVEMIYTGDEKSLIREVRVLHEEIAGHIKSSLEKAFTIGGLLVLQKGRLQHGQFTSWLKKNVPFSERTARNYMRLFNDRYKLKTANVSDLSEAYRFLKRLKWFEPKEIENNDEAEERSFITLSLDIYQKEIIMTAVEKAKKLLNTESNARAFEHIAYDWYQSSADGPALISIEAAKRLFEETYNVTISIGN